MMAVKQSYFA